MNAIWGGIKDRISPTPSSVELKTMKTEYYLLANQLIQKPSDDGFVDHEKNEKLYLGRDVVMYMIAEDMVHATTNPNMVDPRIA